MAIQLVGIRSSGSSTAGATSITVDLPDGTDGDDLGAVEAGDFAVLTAEVTSSTPATWSATGWDPQAGDAGAAAQIEMLTRRIASGDTSVTVSPGLTSGQVSGLSAVVRVYRGVDPDAPLDVAAVADGSSSATASVAAASLTTETDGAVVVAAYGQTTPGGVSYTNWTAPSGMSHAGNVCSTVSAVNNAALASFDETVATAGATGTLTATSPQSRPWTYATLALAPAPPETPATFPDAPLDLSVELCLAGDGWTGITSKVYERDPITITRGQSADASTADPSTLALTLNNRDSRFSPRAPAGAYYGKLGRNTPIRVAVDRPASPVTRLDYTGAATPWGVVSFETSDLDDPVGDLDVRVDVEPRLGVWTANTALISKYTTVSDQRSWVLYTGSATDDPGTLVFAWSTDGTSGTTTVVKSTDAIDVTAERLAIRVTLDVDNGASGSTVTFYTATSIDDDWTQLGDAVTNTGASSVYLSTTPVMIGRAGGGQIDFNGYVYAVAVLDGIGDDGTAWIDLDFRTIAEGTSAPVTDPLVDDAGREWVIYPGSAIVAPEGIRFCGEVSEWPVRWDSTGTDVYTTVTAAGVLRRLQQGTTPVRSTLTRILSIKPACVAYWPCEDGQDATQIASGIGGPPMSFGGTALPSFASYTGFHSSNAIPSMNDAEWNGSVPPYFDTGEIQVRCLLSIPADTETTAEQSIIAIATAGTACVWHLSYMDGGALRLEAFSNDQDTSDPIFTTDAISFGLLGKDARVSVLLTQVDSDVEATIGVYPIGAPGGTFWTQTLSSSDIGRATSITVNNGGGITDLAIGQISVEDTVTSIFDDVESVNAFISETAGRRFLRLANENGVYARCYGDPADTPRMGPQDPDTLVNLLSACIDSDGGQMFEPRDVAGVAMRTRASLQNRDTDLTLDYTTDLAGDIEPTDDDRYITNDVTITRTGGSSTQVEDTTGALNVSDPPDGAGRYATAVELSLYRDLDTIDQAWWHLHTGTVDEPRYPTLTVDLSRREITGDSTVQDELVAADVGDRITVTNPPAWLPPGTVEQVLVGVTETLSSFTRTHAYALAPYSPYVVAVYDDGRYDTAGASLATGATSAQAQGAGTTTRIVLTDADAADFGVGAVFQLHDADGDLKESTAFTVTATTSFAGFTNVDFTPAAQAATDGTFGGTGDEAWLADETSLSVATSTGPLWTTDSDDVPFDVMVGGERMTVTAVTGSSSPQTFTVTRSVNDIVKAHASGTDVRLFQPAIRAL